MTTCRLSPAANERLDEIYNYTRRQWGEDQAASYIRSLFECFERISESRAVSRTIPAEFGVDGYFCRHERHFVYWRRLDDGAIGIVTVLHESMNQLDRLKDLG